MPAAGLVVDVHQVHGKASERVGTSCETMSAARIEAVLDDRRGYDWSAEDSGVATSAVAARAVEEERSLLADVPDPGRRRWALLPLPDLLRRLGVVTAAGGLTNGGALLFAPFRLDLISYTPSDALRGAHGNERLSGPGLTVLLRCFELIDGRTDRTPVNLPSGQQLFIADLPRARSVKPS